MLQISGKVLDVTSETVGSPGNSFVSTTVSLLSGKARVEQVRLGRDFPTSQTPKEGDECTMAVFVSAYTTRNGAGYRLTATERISAAPAGARISAAS